VLDASQISGVGAQLVSKLREVGIRTAADFSGISYINNGGSTTVYFRRTSGGRVHVPGIGEVKARRIEQWRQGQLSQAISKQPVALSAAEQQDIDSQFATQARQLEAERARITQLVADQINVIQQELKAALADADRQFEAERVVAEHGKAESADLLRRAYSDHLAVQQKLLAWDDNLSRVQKRSFIRFVKTTFRG
jgi:limonene-1,2-epoxide hydrolase